ncbi:MAG: RHS repeat-associated core domain-containing protein, partial [Fimbriimonadaceae bacterium]
DTHGNMTATLSLTGSGTGWNIANERSYDVWGGVRSGSGPKNGYVANLGHVKDDESGLIYMRARYYEPESGRFVSEDPACFNSNWYIYARNAPTIFADSSGKIFEQAIVGLLKFLLGHLLMGMTDELVTRLDTLTRYLNQLDDLAAMEKIAGVYRYTDVSGDALEIRKEVMAIHKKLKQIRGAEGAIKWGTKLGKGLDKVFGAITGYSFIISALIDDIDMAPSGYGSLEAIYGG